MEYNVEKNWKKLTDNEKISFENQFFSYLWKKFSYCRIIMTSLRGEKLMNSNSPIGVFDSGLGGISVLKTISKVLPNEDLIFLGDSLHNPYGTKSKEEITERCIKICDYFHSKDVKAIVIACNTATSACVPLLREKYSVDIIGMEPALKVACKKGNHQKIAVWATDFTLKEKKFERLMKDFEDDHEIYKVPCPKLVELVEQDKLDDLDLVTSVLQDYINQTDVSSLDSIVLGCTHFVFYRDILKTLLPESVKIIDGNMGTALHLKNLLDEKGLLNENGGSIKHENTLEDKFWLSEKLFRNLEV